MFSAGNWAKLGIPLAVLAIAALFGADRHNWVLALSVITGVLGLFFNRPPIKRSLFVLWWTSLVFIVWHLFTLISLPAPGLGTERADYFQESAQKISELSELPIGEVNSDSQSDQSSVALFNDIETSNGNSGHLSLNQAGTKRFIITLIGSLSMFWLATAMTLDQRMRFLAYIAVGGTAVAVIGLIGQYIIPVGERIWWIIPAEQPVAPGPFLYTHHFIAFCAILTPVVLSLVIVPIPLIRRRHSRAKRKIQLDNSSISASDSSTLPSEAHKKKAPSHSTSESETKFSSWSRDWLRTGRLRFFYGFCLLLMILPPLLSFSRGIVITVIIGCLVTILHWLRNRSPLTLVNIVLLIGLLFVFLQWLGTGEQKSLSLEKENAPHRSMVMRETLSQWSDFKFLGGGGESFRVLNATYKQEPDTATPHYADNEYLQFLADHGLFGSLLGAVTLTVLLIAFWSNFHSRFQRTKTLRALRDTWSRDRDIVRRHRSLYASVVSLSLLAAVCGSLAGLLLLFACGFPTRSPLNAFVVAALIGLIMPLPQKPNNERSLYWHWALIPFVAISLIVNLTWTGRDMKLDNPYYLRQADIPRLAEAIRAAPSYWLPWAELSQRIREQANRHLQTEDNRFFVGTDHLRMYNFGVNCLERSAELNPRNTDLWWELAQIRVKQDNIAPEKAVRSLQKSARLSPEKEKIWRAWLDFVLSQQHIEFGLELGREAQTRAEPAVALDIWTEIRLLSQQLQSTEAEYQATEALTKLQPQNVSWWQKKARLSSSLTKTDNEIRARQQITRLQPENWENWLELGKLYWFEGNQTTAERAFGRVRQLQPEASHEIEKILDSEPE